MLMWLLCFFCRVVPSPGGFEKDKLVKDGTLQILWCFKTDMFSGSGPSQKDQNLDFVICLFFFSLSALRQVKAHNSHSGFSRPVWQVWKRKKGPLNPDDFWKSNFFDVKRVASTVPNSFWGLSSRLAYLVHIMFLCYLSIALRTLKFVFEINKTLLSFLDNVASIQVSNIAGRSQWCASVYSRAIADKVRHFRLLTCRALMLVSKCDLDLTIFNVWANAAKFSCRSTQCSKLTKSAF